MLIETTQEFKIWRQNIRRLALGDLGMKLISELVNLEMDLLERLTAPPRIDSKKICRIRSSKQHQIWRVSHPFVDGIAIRLIVWFPPVEIIPSAVVVLGANKAEMGDIFYDGVGARADGAINKWVREKQKEERDRSIEEY